MIIEKAIKVEDLKYYVLVGFLIQRIMWKVKTYNVTLHG